MKDLTARICSVGVFRTPSTIESFNVDYIRVPHGSTPAVKFRDDVYMLFNQQRLDSKTLEGFINSLNNCTFVDRLAPIRSKLTDKQLHMFCKSRYIQTQSELLSYSTYIDKNFGDLRNEMDALYQKYESEQQQQQTE